MGRWRDTCRHSMGRKRLGDGVGKPLPPEGSHIPI